jgi:hypothetical protein
MSKHVVLAVLAGWLISLVFPPSSLLGMFRGVFGNA